MHRKKKKICLKEGDILFGFGYKTIAKYLVKRKHENGGWVITLLDEKKKSTFRYPHDELVEGNTLYKNGLRCFSHSKVREHNWKIVKTKERVYDKLAKMQKVVDSLKGASSKRTLLLSDLLDKFFEGMSKKKSNAVNG